MAGRSVKRLYDIEVDEISLVDRPANQHGAVVIAKRAAEDTGMALYDDEGYELDEELLEGGETVYDENGTEYEIMDAEKAAELGFGVDDDAQADYLEDELVGAGAFGKAMPGEMGPAQRRLLKAGMKGRGYAGNKRVRQGAALAGAAGAGVAGGRMSKSLGDDVYEELAKALRGNDQREAISKLAEIVKTSREETAEAWAVAKALADERDEEDFVQLASTYQVAADPAELGGVLSRIAKNAAGPQDLALLDRLLSQGPASFEEAGYSGYAENSVMDQVMGIAEQAVGKRNDVTREEAIIALFDTNPEAYDMYLAEQV